MMIALRVAEQFLMRLVECPKNSILEAKTAGHEPVMVYAHNPQTGHDEIFEICNLHHERDGWGVNHLVGNILGEVAHHSQPFTPQFIPVTFVDNEHEANPLSFR